MVSGRDRRSAGFTLVELVAVFLLLAVLVAVVVTRSGNAGNQVPGTAELLVQNLAYARSRAMSTTNTWSLAYGVGGVSLARDGAAFPLPDSATATVPAGVTISGGDGGVTFDSFGAPDAQKGISVTDGTSTRTVTVWAETGLIE